MPFIRVSATQKESAAESAAEAEDELVEIFYRTYGTGETKIVLIMGFGAGHGGWHPQVIDLAGSLTPNEVEEDLPELQEKSLDEKDNTYLEILQDGQPITAVDEKYTCLVFDNRGIGNSSCPEDKSLYTTEIMAKDVLSLMDHLFWEKAHVAGHSMGGMIASKLAAMAPEKVQSLAILSSSCGGIHALPKITRRSLSVAYRLMTATSPESRAKADVEAHYSKDHLNEVVDGTPRREIIIKKYVQSLSTSSPQNSYGIDGHLNACVTHTISHQDLQALRSGNFLISIIHGRHDIIAHVSKGERLFRRMKDIARMVTLPGGHMINMEKPSQVNAAMKELIRAAKEGVPHLEWVKGSTLWSKMKEEGQIIREAAIGGVESIGAVSTRAYEVPRLIFEFLATVLAFLLFWLLMVVDYSKRMFSMRKREDKVTIHRSPSAKKFLDSLIQN